MTNENWIKIYVNPSLTTASIIKNLLEENNIQSVILNKKDSSYNNFGNCEIFVTPTEAKAASDIINEYFRI